MNNKVFLIIAIILAICIVICIVKKIVKFIIFILIILFLFSVIKGFTTGKNPNDITNLMKTDTIYAKSLYNYTSKIKEAVEKSVGAIQDKSLPIFKEQNKRLHTYLESVIQLPHGEALDGIHNKYCNYLKSIVVSSDTVVNTSDFSENTLSKMKKNSKYINKFFENLSNDFSNK